MADYLIITLVIGGIFLLVWIVGGISIVSKKMEILDLKLDRLDIRLDASKMEARKAEVERMIAEADAMLERLENDRD